MTTTLHAHVETYSTDCDGAISRDYIMYLSNEEIAEHVKGEVEGNDFHDIHFKERVIRSQISVYSEHGILRFTQWGFEWSEGHDEGVSSAEVKWCTDECENVSSYRDHRAESMGY